MTIENFENIVSLFCTIVGLLYCIFQYIETPRRWYKYLVAFFLADFLSEYYWTTYELVMGAYPDVSEFTAYLGWNVGYFLLFLTAFHMRNKGRRRFFHPVILLPVLTNIPQFLLYIRYGGVLNNLWEVGLTTITMIVCLQEIVYYVQTRENNTVAPWFFLLVFVNLMFQYGMWTASCFTWEGELRNPYFYCSVLSSFICVFFGYGARRHYEAEGAVQESKSASELRFQVLVQTIVSLVVIGICACGFFTVSGVKKSISNQSGFFRTEKQVVI